MQAVDAASIKSLHLDHRLERHWGSHGAAANKNRQGEGMIERGVPVLGIALMLTNHSWGVWS